MNNVETINPLDLPNLPLEERRALPDCAAIYFVLDNDDAVLYIGRAISLVRRWMAHHRAKQLLGIGSTRIAWLAVSDIALLDDIERACIIHFEPSLNGDEIDGGSKLAKDGETWITVRVPQDVKDWLDEWAIKKERSVSFLVRRLILRAHRNHEQFKDEA